jgi:hypothetical protein
MIGIETRPEAAAEDARATEAVSTCTFAIQPFSNQLAVVRESGKVFTG